MIDGGWTRRMGPAQSASPPALLVFADDWGRHPSSCQHLVSQLLPRYRVWWVNTIGMRRPRLDLASLNRGLEKLRAWAGRSKGDRPLSHNPQVVSPRMWPWFGSSGGRRLNRVLLVKQLVPVLRSIGTPIVAITTIPIVADLIGLLPVQRWVYYCVDDFAQWPGLDGEALQEMEREVVDKVNVRIAASEILRTKLASAGHSVRLLTHGVDLAHWRTNGFAGGLPQTDAFERPLIVFWGVIDRRMDTRFVRQLASDLEYGTIVLVGPESDPDPALVSLPRVVRPGPLAYNRLPQLARRAEVLIMPYADLPVTRAMQPLKMKEYLATGKPVVSTDLPAVRDWADCLDVVHSPTDFSQMVRKRLAEGLPLAQLRARDRLEGESWAEKARQFEEIALKPLALQA